MTFTTESAPPEQRKKVTLLLYFIQYMNEHLINSEELASSSASSYSSAVFMKKWFRTDKAVVMYLNNGTLQVTAFLTYRFVVIVKGTEDVNGQLKTFPKLLPFSFLFPHYSSLL